MASPFNQDLARFGKALSHPRRVLILQTLLKNPAAGESFGRLALETKLASSTLEHHIRVLQTTGIVQRWHKRSTSRYELKLGQMTSTLNQFIARIGHETAPKKTGPGPVTTFQHSREKPETRRAGAFS